MPVFLNTQAADFDADFTALLSAKREDSPDVDEVVAGIIHDVRTRGDAAVIELTAKFDRLELTPETLRFSESEIAALVAQVSDAERAALELAAERIRAYHAKQLPEDMLWEEETGAQLGWRWTPVSALPRPSWWSPTLSHPPGRGVVGSSSLSDRTLGGRCWWPPSRPSLAPFSSLWISTSPLSLSTGRRTS